MTLSSSLFNCSNCSSILGVTSAAKGTAFLGCPNCGKTRGQVPIVHLLNALMRDVRALSLANEGRRAGDRQRLTFEDVKEGLINLLSEEDSDDYYD